MSVVQVAGGHEPRCLYQAQGAPVQPANTRRTRSTARGPETMARAATDVVVSQNANPRSNVNMWIVNVQRPGFVTASVQESTDPSEQFNRLSGRARIDYEQMPGLSLTARQAAELWNVSPAVSQRVLSSLVDVGYVKKGPSGYVRASLGRVTVFRGVN